MQKKKKTKSTFGTDFYRLHILINGHLKIKLSTFEVYRNSLQLT